METDLFNDIIQSYENLKQRAEEIFKIRAKYHLPKQYNEIDNIMISQFDVSIESSEYFRGERDIGYCIFPSSLLLSSDEKADEHFRKEKEEIEERKRQVESEWSHKENEKREVRERAELERLIKKYCKGE